MFIKIPLWGWSFTIGTEPTDSVSLTKTARVKLNSALGYLFASRDLDFEEEEFTGTPGDTVVEFFTEPKPEETNGHKEAVLLISRILKYGGPDTTVDVIESQIVSTLDEEADRTPEVGSRETGIFSSALTGDDADDAGKEADEVIAIFCKTPAMNKFRLRHGGLPEEQEDAEMALVNTDLIANARIGTQGKRTREEAAGKSILQRALIAKARENFPVIARASLVQAVPQKSRTARRRKTTR